MFLLFTFELGEAAAASSVRTLQQIFILVVAVVLAAGFYLVVRETLPECVHIFWLPFIWRTHVTLETCH